MAQLLFLGTGAADWVLEEKAGFFRRYSAALINGELLLDCGPHLFDFAQSICRPDLYDGVTDILITHSHDDHFCRSSVLTLAEHHPLRIGCDDHIRGLIGDHEHIQFLPLSPLQTVQLGGYRVTPLLANHDTIISDDSRAYHYIVQAPDDKTLFYGLDGAWFLAPSWEEMKKHRFDVMVLECTVGDLPDWRLFSHNSIPMLRMMVREIREQQLLKENGRLIVSHLARTLHTSHEETVQLLKQIDVATAFDGLQLDW